MKVIVSLFVLAVVVVFSQLYVVPVGELSPEAGLVGQFKSFLESSPLHRVVHWKRVSVGYNTNTDLVADAISVLQLLGHSKPPAPSVRPSLEKMDDFTSLVAYFMAQGSAVERVILNMDLCETIVKAAQQAQGVEHIGGNAALIAMRMAEKTKVVLAGSLSENLKKKLHSNISLLEGAEAANPSEAHLILEYKKGQTWGDIVAPRANRVIVHCDRTNAELKVLKPFHTAVNSNSDLMVISGLHLLDQDPIETQQTHLRDVLEQLSTLSPITPVHLELASVGNLDYVELVGRTLIPNFNSIGLNEQELGFLYFALSRPVSTFSSAEDRLSQAEEFVRTQFRDPSLQQVTEALSYIFDLPNTSARRLDRVHFHSLKFHVIAIRKNGGWQNPASGLIHGSIAASTNACGIDSFAQLNHNNFDLLLPPSEMSHFAYSPTHQTTIGDIEYHTAPVLVCKNPVRTVGLGDAISAAGLLHHGFSLVD